MWHTPRGNRVMRGAEWALFREGISSLFDRVQDACDFSDPELVDTGVAAFDELQPSQQLALLAVVGKAMSDEREDAPALMACNEATVAAVFRQLVTDVCMEIDGVFGSSTGLRSLIIAACRELVAEHDAEQGIKPGDDFDPESDAPWVVRTPPDAADRDYELWESILTECLAERVLWGDGDHEMGAAFLDEDPELARKKRAALGIDEDYFSSAPPDATMRQVTRIRRELERLCGRRTVG